MGRRELELLGSVRTVSSGAGDRPPSDDCRGAAVARPERAARPCRQVGRVGGGVETAPRPSAPGAILINRLTVTFARASHEPGCVQSPVRYDQVEDQGPCCICSISPVLLLSCRGALQGSKQASLINELSPSYSRGTQGLGTAMPC